jgi:hypothetical protein
MSHDFKAPPVRPRRMPHNNLEAAAARTALAKEIATEENAARDARTAKLRALRLAKEEAEGANGVADSGAPEVMP